MFKKINLKTYKLIKYLGKNYIINTIQNLIPFYPSMAGGANSINQLVVYEILIKTGLTSAKIASIIIMFL